MSMFTHKITLLFYIFTASCICFCMSVASFSCMGIVVAMFVHMRMQNSIYAKHGVLPLFGNRSAAE